MSYCNGNSCYIWVELVTLDCTQKFNNFANNDCPTSTRNDIAHGLISLVQHENLHSESIAANDFENYNNLFLRQLCFLHIVRRR